MEEDGTEQEDPRTKRMGQFTRRLPSGMKVVPKQPERQELLHIHSRPTSFNTAAIKHLKHGWSELRCKCNKTHVCVHAKSLQLCLTLCDPWPVAHQAPLSIGFSRQEYWRGLLWLSPGDLPDPGIESASPVAPELQGDS